MGCGISAHPLPAPWESPAKSSSCSLTLGASRARLRGAHPLPQLIPDRTGDIQDFYDAVGCALGVGASGCVHEIRHRNSGAVYAAKTIPAKGMCTKEVEILKSMDHPNIVRLQDAFEDAAGTCLVMELCRGGELLDRIQEAGHFSERQVAALMPQLLRAVDYMHRSQVCHRDLKPENLLLAERGPVEEGRLRVADFGFARRFMP